jgi:uncharacterized membrane protein YidH (DUF202 family)
MSNAAPQPDDTEYATRSRRNLAAIIALLTLAIIAIAVLNRLDKQRQLQRCLDSGRRDCVEIYTPPRPQVPPR